MVTLIFILLFSITLMSIVFFVHKSERWFPIAEEFRIREKTIGELTFYRAEVYRKYFGWTPFYAGAYRGSIWRDDSFTSNKNECEEWITIYRKLRPLK